MFENGILATFIPEVFMVFGFLLCLFVPGSIAKDPAIEQTSIVAQVSTFNQEHTASSQLSTYQFQTTPELIPEHKLFFPRFIEKRINVCFESHFSTSDGLSFVDFSRPPPFFLL